MSATKVAIISQFYSKDRNPLSKNELESDLSPEHWSASIVQKPAVYGVRRSLSFTLVLILRLSSYKCVAARELL